jgi:hypothetical protein
MDDVWRCLLALTLPLWLAGCELTFNLMGGFGPRSLNQTEKLQMAVIPLLMIVVPPIQRFVLRQARLMPP